MASFIGNLTVFDHSVQEWPIFKSRLDQFIKLNEIKSDKAGSLLITYLADDTYRLARNLLHPKILEDVKFEELVLVLDKHFTPKRCLLAEREKFYEARRAAGESVQEWAVRVRGLAVNCEFGTALDNMLRDRFVLGLYAGSERDRLFEVDAANLTFAKALEVAQQAASARQARAGASAAGHVKEEPVYRVTAARSGVGAGVAGRSSDGEVSRRCTVCGLRNHDAIRCRYRNYRCQLCGVKGHLKKVCNSAKKSTSSRLHNLGTDPEVTEDGNGCENCQECEVYNMRYVSYSPILVKVNIKAMDLEMELDSGSGSSVISEILYKKCFSDLKLNSCDLRMCLYNGHKISPLGYFEAIVSYNNKKHSIKFYVVRNGGPPLLGRDFMTKFGLFFTSSNNNINTDQYPSEVPQLIKDYSILFEDALGKFNKFTVDLQLKEGASPKFCKPRTVPFALKQAVEDEINRLVGLGILIPVNFSKYATPIVPVLKGNGKVKIAGDYSITLNKDLQIDKYPMPRIEEVFARLGGGECYTKIDLSNAYNQWVLSESSQELTTINTSKGLYKYTRLVYGLANAPAIFQRSMETLLAGIEGVSCWLDDVCVTGPSKDIHIARLREVLRRMRDAGLRLQKEKCVFFQDSVTYLGYVISKHGLSACKKKVEAIVKASRPNNVLEVKRFLGVINYYRNFIPDASSKLGPLHELLRADAKWEWGERQERAFISVKQELASERLLAHFEPNAQLVLTVDAGPQGLGAVLAQLDSDGRERPLAFASRSLTSSEKNYSQIQKEATAIVFGVKHFHQYLYGRQEPFILKTDHQPLLSIFGNKAGISVMAASRLQRYAILLSAYNYKVQYIRTDKNVVADYFSRAPISESVSMVNEKEEDRSFLNFLDTNIAPVTFHDIRQATKADKVMQTVISYMRNGWPRKITCKHILPYFHCKADLELDSGCIFRGHRIVVPTEYRHRMLKELHSGHFGVVKTKSVARSRFWWPSIDKEIEAWVGSCVQCSAVRSAPPRAEPAPWPAETGPWKRLHIDYLSIGQRTYLVVIDAFSKWLECLFMNGGTSTRALITKLKDLFSRFGIPKVIISDNDAKIKSQEFIHFCLTNGIRHVTTPIYHPASNGQAENSVKTCKKMLKCILADGSSQKGLDETLLGFLFDYRNTKHCATGLSPAKLMIGRELRSRLDLVLPDKEDTNRQTNEGCSRHLQIGDVIWLKWFSNKKESWVLGKIIDKLGSRMYTVSVTDYNTTCIRHIDQLRRYTGFSFTPDNEDINENVTVTQTLPLATAACEQPSSSRSPVAPPRAESEPPSFSHSPVAPPHAGSEPLMPEVEVQTPSTVELQIERAAEEEGEDEWSEAQNEPLPVVQNNDNDHVSQTSGPASRSMRACRLDKKVSYKNM